MFLDLFPHPFGEGHAGVEDGPRQQQHELFAAIPADAIDLPCLVAQDACKLLEHGVARLVAVLVVHTLEAVDVAHHAGERLAQPRGVLEHFTQPLLEMPSIVEPREGIRL